MKVHPVADLFPMLADDELASLAADIAERGLLQPIVLDVEGRILDGRNRLAACKLAGIKPEFVTYEGDYPDEYALAVNIERRNLTKGQRGVILARFLEKHPKALRQVAAGVSPAMISKANVIFRYAPDLAEAVEAGYVQLNEAYDTARQRKKDAEGDEAKLAELRAARPDLADLVVEGSLTLLAARAARLEDERRAQENQRDSRTLLRRAVELIAPESMDGSWATDWAAHLGPVDDELAALIKRADIAIQVLTDLTDKARG